MNKLLKNLYTFICFLSIIVYIYNLNDTLKKPINLSKEIKYLLVGFANIVMVFSLYYTNPIVNKYIAPLCVFINVAMLLYISLNNDELSIIHIISMIGIVYLLISLAINYKKFEIKYGAFHIQSNRQWVYSFVIILGLWFITTTDKGWVFPNDNIKNKIVSCLLLLYPLLFPVEEYFIHRPASLVAVYLLLTYNIKL